MKCLKELYTKKKIKTMNIKMEMNSQVSMVESKIKLSKQAEQEQNHKYGGYLEGYLLGGGRGRNREKVLGLRSRNR